MYLSYFFLFFKLQVGSEGGGIVYLRVLYKMEIDGLILGDGVTVMILRVGGGSGGSILLEIFYFLGKI